MANLKKSIYTLCASSIAVALLSITHYVSSARPYRFLAHSNIWFVDEWKIVNSPKLAPYTEIYVLSVTPDKLSSDVALEIGRAHV